MARIKGVDIPNEKRVVISLTYIYGIGKKTSEKILDAVKIDHNIRVKDLSKEQLAVISNEVSKHTVEGDLRREVSMNIKTEMEIGSYRGLRHRKGLPVRGQRTNRNCRSSKKRRGLGKVVANKKKVG